jgi:peptidoglycan hydrolase-like protein with peptidoglycan-binding domain
MTKIHTILLASVVAIAGCEPYAGNAPTGYGEAQYINVRNAQGGLSQLGYYGGPIDGVNGPETRQAVQRYQSDRGLYPNGTIDEQLISRINGDLGAATNATADQSQDRRVSRAQAALSQLGYYRGRIDGQLDGDTRAAIVSYRRERQLPISDVIDRQLMSSLERDLASGPAQNPYSSPAPDRFMPGDRLPGDVRAVLDRQWQSYDGMLVDLAGSGNADVIARSGQRSGACRNGECEYIVLENRRGGYVRIGSFVASDAEVLRRSTNGYSDIAYRSAYSSQPVLLRFDGRGYRS